MKKLSLLLIAVVMLLIPFAVRADEKAKINVYLFRGEGCPHCEEAIEWFDNTLSKDEEYSNKYELVQYEVWYDQDNAGLMDKVASALGTEANGVPFIVIGDKYFSGFAESVTPDQIKEAINTYYGNSEYTDVVDAVINNKTIDPKKAEENNQLLPIIIVSAAAIVIVIGLIFFTKERE